MNAPGTTSPDGPTDGRWHLGLLYRSLSHLLRKPNAPPRGALTLTLSAHTRVEIYRPVAALPGLMDRPRQSAEELVQREIMADRILHTPNNASTPTISPPPSNISEDPGTHLPRLVLPMVPEPLVPLPERVVDALQRERLARAPQDRRPDQRRIRVVRLRIPRVSVGERSERQAAPQPFRGEVGQKGRARGDVHYGRGLRVERGLWRGIWELLGRLGVRSCVVCGVGEGCMWRLRREGGLRIVREVCIRVVARDVEGILRCHEVCGREGGPESRFEYGSQLL